MFRELIKLRELSRLCRKKKWREVLDLARDPSIRDHRKAILAAERARQALLDDAMQRRDAGELTRAFEDVRTVLRDHEAPEARQVERDVRKAIGEREARARAAAVADGDARRREAREEWLRKADEQIRRGDLDEAMASLEQASRGGVPGADTVSAWVALLEAACRSADAAVLASVLDRTRRTGAGIPAVQAAREAAAARFASAVEALLVAGDVERAAGLLARRPFGAGADAALAALRDKAGRVAHAFRLGEAGDPGLAAEALAEALSGLPDARALRERLKDLRSASEAAREPIQEARAAFAGGLLSRARGLLLDVLEAQPRHREAAELLSRVERQAGEDLETLRKAQDLLGLGVEGSLDDCRRLLEGLKVSRPDLADVPVLLRDVDRRIRDAQARAPATASAVGASPARSPATPADGESAIRRGGAFILRVEEQGDWFVHPGDRVLLGNSLRGIADLPVLAAIGARHAWFERHRSGADEVGYRLVVEPGKKAVRNRRPVEGWCQLSHGDVVVLGDVLSLTFLRPVPSSASAVLRFDGDFPVQGCRQVILFAESGRAGSLVIGPAPEAHVPLAREAERVEIFRGIDGEGEGMLLARSPRGVAVGEGQERPQIRVQAGVALRAGDVGFFLDPA